MTLCGHGATSPEMQRGCMLRTLIAGLMLNVMTELFFRNMHCLKKMSMADYQLYVATYCHTGPMTPSGFSGAESLRRATI